jgi:hypothetical protein
MKWILILLAVNMSNANDIPGRITIEFSTEQECIRALNTMTYKLKFDSFKVSAECKKL